MDNSVAVPCQLWLKEVAKKDSQWECALVLMGKL